MNNEVLFLLYCLYTLLFQTANDILKEIYKHFIQTSTILFKLHLEVYKIICSNIINLLKCYTPESAIRRHLHLTVTVVAL